MTDEPTWQFFDRRIPHGIVLGLSVLSISYVRTCLWHIFLYIIYFYSQRYIQSNLRGVIPSRIIFTFRFTIYVIDMTTIMIDIFI